MATTRRNDRRETGVTSRALPVAMLTWLLAGLAPACGGDDETGESKAGVRGESCTSSKDCGSGLACIGSVCSIRTFEVTARTQYQCVLIECRRVDDCLPSYCASLQAQCNAGNQTACAQVSTDCRADLHDCRNDACVLTCNTESDCLYGTCVNGECTDCATDTDCYITGQVCVDNQCTAGCSEKADCPVFHDCVNRRCVNVGCSSDRECVAATGSTRATCASKECVVPCETDIQCDSDPLNSFDFTACIQGRCTPLGCQTDAECRIILGTSSLGLDAECRQGN
jgi:hypothetical protein